MFILKVVHVPGVVMAKPQGGYKRTFSMLLRIVEGLHKIKFNFLLFFSDLKKKSSKITVLEDGRINGVVFHDICKAFDSVNHEIPLENFLKPNFGIHWTELKWFQSYLKDRKQVCFVNDQTSLQKIYVEFYRDQYLVRYCFCYVLMICLAS